MECICRCTTAYNQVAPRVFIWGMLQLLRLQPEEKDSLDLQNGCLCQGWCSDLSALHIPNNAKLFLEAFVRGIYEIGFEVVVGLCLL